MSFVASSSGEELWSISWYNSGVEKKIYEFVKQAVRTLQVLQHLLLSFVQLYNPTESLFYSASPHILPGAVSRQQIHRVLTDVIL